MAVYENELRALGVTYTRVYDPRNGEEVFTFRLKTNPEFEFTLRSGELETCDANDIYQKLLVHLDEPDFQTRNKMLETLIKLYTTYMRMDVRSPIPHLAGPPGVGKSETVAQLAETVGKKLHIINVSRINPMELEGLQMPTARNTKLSLLLSPMWANLQEGDVVLFDEFLRGFPEVYNGLLDIFTSRHVAGYDLPRVFIVAASNSIVTYDPALEDRLLHLFVPDLRSSTNTRYRVQQMFCEKIGILPDMAKSTEMTELFDKHVLPMFGVLDQFKHKPGAGTSSPGGKSVRNLIGQALLRQVETPELKSLIVENNRRALSAGKYQFVLLLNGRNIDPKYKPAALKLVGNDKLSMIQAGNLDLNLQLIEMEETKRETPMKKEEETDDVELD